MKKIIITAIVIIILSGLILYITWPRFPNKCPYGHSNLEEGTQKVSFKGRPSCWTLFKLKYINPPEKHMYCKECGWIIRRNGQSHRESKDPKSFIPPIPQFATFNYPEMHFTYSRALNHGNIVFDYVDIQGLFTKKVEDYILVYLKKNGFDQFKETKYKNDQILQAANNGYVIRIRYDPKTRNYPRIFRGIFIIYPGQDQNSIDH